MDDAYALSEWSIDVSVKKGSDDPLRLLGITEDITCGSDSCHIAKRECRLICNACKVPVCRECQIGLYAYNPERKLSTVPMSLANDHMYGYVGKLLAEKHVTWLECAAASLVWSTILVYYLEAPYGHLMQEKWTALKHVRWRAEIYFPSACHGRKSRLAARRPVATGTVR